MEFDAALVAQLKQRADRYEEITGLLGVPEVASDGKQLAGLLRERGALERAHQMFGELSALGVTRAEAEAIVQDGGDDELVALALEELAELTGAEERLDEQVKLALISDPTDERRKVIVEIRAGTGGDEATLFAADLFRMYNRFCDGERLKVELLGANESVVGGYKEVTFGVAGENAWRRMRFESGGHRVQRVPSTESQGRVHTSAVTVAVMPEADELDVVIDNKDIRKDTFRSSGAGGQHVNKTDSAVRLTHLPTGIVVECQDERSQHKNKARAMSLLKSRMLSAEQERHQAEQAQQRKSLVGSGDRSERIRTYNYPQGRVSDHRINLTLYKLEDIMQGNLGLVIEPLLNEHQAEQLANLAEEY